MLNGMKLIYNKVGAQNDSLCKHVYQYQKMSGLYVIKGLYGN